MQFLVLNMETMIANQTDCLTRIVQHLGLDIAPLQDQLSLPRANVDPHKEDVTPLSTLDPALCLELKAIYAPHVRGLLAMLQTPGLSPHQPPFPPFADPCPGLADAKVGATIASVG